MVLHLDLDSFFVSVECLLNPSLKGKPVIVGGDGQRGVVSSCSYEARAKGVHSAMPALTARKRCPEAIFISGHHALYSEWSQKVTEIVAAKAPAFEKASIDEFYVDLSGMDTYFNPYQWALELKTEIQQKTGLPISFGLSTNKLLAKMATNAGKPNGQKHIAANEVQSFLDPLPVEAIPMVGDKTADSLHMRGIKTIAQLRQQPLSLLTAWYGKTGTFLYDKARGISHSRVGESHPVRSLSREHTFETDQQDIGLLSDYIFQLSERLVFDLLREEKTCGSLTLKIRYANFDTFTRQCSFSSTDSLKEITATAIRFFENIYDGKRKIRLIGVRLGQLQQDVAVLSLFNDYSREKKMTTAVNELKTKYGNRKIGLARSQEVMKKRRG